jgi:hypothetical protein
MKLERGLKQSDDLPYRYNYRLLNQSWLERKLLKAKKRKQEKLWRDAEVNEHGTSIHGIREAKSFRWI